MKYYTIFYNTNSFNGKIQEGTGSDSVYRLDGRNNVLTMKNDSQARARQLKNVQNYTHFKICRGTRLDKLQPVTGLILIEREDWKWIRTGLQKLMS